MASIESLHCEWRGGRDPSKDTVIYLHDGLGAIGSWQTMPDRIAAATNTNALIYDRLGYGRSAPRREFAYGFLEAEAPELLALMDSLDIERAHLVGHSDGGTISLVFAALYPQRTGAVTVEAAHVFVEPIMPVRVTALIEDVNGSGIPHWLTKLHGERAESLVRGWAGHWLDESVAGWNIEHFVNRIQSPLLVIQGADDDYGTLAQVDSIVSRAANGSRWVLPQCSHIPHAEFPGQYAEKVSAFINDFKK